MSMPPHPFPTARIVRSGLLGALIGTAILDPVLGTSVAGEHADLGALGEAVFDPGVDPELWCLDHEIERTWRPAYLDRLRLATPRPRAVAPRDLGWPEGRRSTAELQAALASHGVYAWPFPPSVSFTLGHAIQSYQYYGGTPYFHHGIDVMVPNGTDVFHRAGGQVVNVENYRPGNDLYWEVAVLDPEGYLWQYHHIDKNTIPQAIKDKFAAYQADPVNGGIIAPDTYIGDIVYWPVVSFGKRFNHLHLNIFEAAGSYVNGLEFMNPVADEAAPQILGVGLLQGGAVYAGNEITGDYSLYARVRDLVLDDVYWLPPYEVTFSVDGGPVTSVWRFDTLPGGSDNEAYLTDYYVVPPTCGDYSCRDFYIDLGFIRDSQRTFPADGGEHTVVVTAYDYAGNATTQTYTWTVIGPPTGTTVWFDDFESDLGWVRDPAGTDTATLGLWERGDPQGTDSSGPKQLNHTVSGSRALVTGLLAGSTAGSYDVDGGLTSMRSPALALPAWGDVTLSFYYYLAHGNNSSSADFLRVTVIGTTTVTVFEELGAADDDDAAWALQNVSLNAFAGQTVHLLVEAADAASASLVEAALDDVRIVVSVVNEPPDALALSNTVVPENQAVGAIVGTFSTTDPNPGDTFTYTFAAGDGDTDNAAFTIAGEVLEAATRFNFEVQDRYEIRIRSTDAGGLWVEEPFVVAVADATPEIFRVTNALDSGEGSLRQAIQDANACLDIAEIILDDDLGTMAPSNPLPALTGVATVRLGAGNLVTAGLIVSGGAAIQLEGNGSTVTGPTTIGGGSLKITDESLGESSVWLGDGGWLRGQGRVGPLTVGNGGQLSPGSSPGTITAGPTTWSAGGAYAVEINDATGSLGADPGWDLLAVEGTLEVAATSDHPFVIVLATLQLDNTPGEMANFDPSQNHTWPIVQTTAGLSGFAAEKLTLNAAGVANELDGGTLSLMVSGNDLVLRFTRRPPTIAGLGFFRATRAASGTSLTWQTLAEIGTVGFHVDRELATGEWQRITADLIPAEGLDFRPHRYAYNDLVSPGAGTGRYRLIEVGLDGQERVLAVAAGVRELRLAIHDEGSGLRLQVEGRPGSRISVQAAAGILGPWSPWSTVTCDAQGRVSLPVERSLAEPARFLRAVEE